MHKTLLPSLPSVRLQAKNATFSTLNRLLNQLAKEVTRVSDSRSHSSQTDPALVRWEDDDFVYLEAKLLGSSGLEAELCVHEGRVFIRVERS